MIVTQFDFLENKKVADLNLFSRTIAKHQKASNEIPHFEIHMKKQNCLKTSSTNLAWLKKLKTLGALLPKTGSRTRKQRTASRCEKPGTVFH